ncbi:MAG: hypothetical protein ACHREM_01440 [Polyangiales bacterium]
MPAPMIVPIVLMGAAALGVAAMDRSKKTGRSSGGARRSYTLDAGLPAPIRDQVLAALANESNPDQLDALATAVAPAYPLSAAALRMKATRLRATNPVAPPSTSADVANASDPLATIPEPTHSQIADQLARQTDASALDTYATQLAPLYPAASTLLRVRAMQLRTAAAAAAVAPPAAPPPPAIAAPPIVAPPPIITPPAIVAAPPVVAPPIVAPPIVVPPPVAAPPAIASSSAGLPTTPIVPPIAAPPVVMPPPPPASVVSGLDPGMPIEVQKAVLGALTSETDPAKLEGFGGAIAAQYPVAAGLLVGKAQMLRARAATPAPALPPAPTAAAPRVPLTMSPYMMGDDRTRVGRNGGRPSGWPFILLRPSDATYPAKIAKEATGFEGNYGEMTSLNPHLAPGGKWITLVAGDALNVPWEWAPTLARIYQVQTDPGVTPQASPVPNAAPLLRPTSTTTSAAPPPPALPPAPPPTSSSSSAPPTTAAPAPPQVPDPLLTYVVQAGDSPSRIAGNIVHDQSRWRELVAANPKKPKSADGNFKSLMPGERLTLPDSWTSTHAASPAAAGGSSVAFA